MHEYLTQTGHSATLEDFEIIGRERSRNHFRRQVMESILTENNAPVLDENEASFTSHIILEAPRKISGTRFFYHEPIDTSILRNSCYFGRFFLQMYTSKISRKFVMNMAPRTCQKLNSKIAYFLALKCWRNMANWQKIERIRWSCKQYLKSCYFRKLAKTLNWLI